MNTTSLVDSAKQAAIEITFAAAEAGEAAGFTGEDANNYGVGVEVRQGGEWVYANDMDEDREIDAVRLYDTVGSRSEECTTIDQIDKAKRDWIACAQRDFVDFSFAEAEDVADA